MYPETLPSNGILFWQHFQFVRVETQIQRQQDELINLLLFFQNKEIKLVISFIATPVKSLLFL
jgi:hypothetical protein